MDDYSAKLAIDLNHLYEGDLCTNTNELVGFPQYKSPEQHSGETYGSSSDVFAFGVLMNEMFKRKRPWSDTQTLKIGPRVINGDRETTSCCPDDIASLITRCWAQDPKYRPTLGSIKNDLHSFLVKLGAETDGTNKQ